MADVRTAWSQAGEQLSGLGLKLKLHYEEQHSTDETAEESRAQDDVRDAVRKLGAAVQDAVDAMSAAARDQAVKDDVKQVGRSLKDALGVTFAEISEELGKAFDRGPGSRKGSGETANGGQAPSTDVPEYGTPSAGAGDATPPAGDPTPPPTPSPAAPPREPGDPTP